MTRNDCALNRSPIRYLYPCWDVIIVRSGWWFGCPWTIHWRSCWRSRWQVTLRAGSQVLDDVELRVGYLLTLAVPFRIVYMCRTMNQLHHSVIVSIHLLWNVFRTGRYKMPKIHRRTGLLLVDKTRIGSVMWNVEQFIHQVVLTYP